MSSEENTHGPEERGEEEAQVADIIEEIEVEDFAIDGICGVY